MPMFFYKLSGKEHKKIVKALEEKRQQNLDETNLLHSDEEVSAEIAVDTETAVEAEEATEAEATETAE